MKTIKINSMGEKAELITFKQANLIANHNCVGLTFLMVLSQGEKEYVWMKDDTTNKSYAIEILTTQ